jgi:hypothetical protein
MRAQRSALLPGRRGMAMKSITRRWVGAAAAATILTMGASTPASAAIAYGDWGKATHTQSQGHLSVDLYTHSWNTLPAPKMDGRFYLSQDSQAKVKQIDIVNVILWVREEGSADWLPQQELDVSDIGRYCLDNCGRNTLFLSTGDEAFCTIHPGTPAPFTVHVEAKYLLQWANGSWSPVKDYNSNDYRLASCLG